MRLRLTVLPVLAAMNHPRLQHLRLAISIVAGMVLVLLPVGAHGADGPDVRVLQADPAGCTWVEATGSVSFGQHDTRHQAKAAAISEARAKAIEGFLGVIVQDRFIHFQQESSLQGQVGLTESLLGVTQLGRILKEDVLSSGLRDMGECAGCLFAARIRACIVPLQEQSDKGFKVDVTLNRTRFVDGDEGIIQVTATRDAYLYIYSVDMEWNAVLFFPNEYAKDNLIKVDQQFVFPSNELKRRGIKIVARLPAGAKVSAEMIRVLASKEPLPPSLFDPTIREVPSKDSKRVTEIQGTGSFLNLLHKLHGTTFEWVEDAQAFTIYKK